MKKGLIVILSLLVLSFGFISAASCELDVSLINQDPYPAIPNDYVEVVFQMSGVDNVNCRDMTFELVSTYPFSIIEGEAIRNLKGSTYVYGYKKEWMIPYKFLVDKDALDGQNEVEVRYASSLANRSTRKKFNISIEDSIAEFEVHIKDYDFSTKELTIEVLNIEDVDVEALTIEILKQENIDIKGSNRVVIGDLDSNEYSSADFEATLTDGEIKVKILYTDQIGIRRELIKNVVFDPSYFVQRTGESQSLPIGYYILVLVVLVIIIWWYVRRRKKKKHLAMKRRGMAKF
jgi:hypothetical protein